MSVPRPATTAATECCPAPEPVPFSGAYFTAPAITPETNCRWKAKKTAGGTTVDTKPPGTRMPMVSPNCRTCRARSDDRRNTAYAQGRWIMTVM